MLFVSWPVADPLERAVTVRRARLILIRTDNFSSFFVLSRCPARLPNIYE